MYIKDVYGDLVSLPQLFYQFSTLPCTLEEFERTVRGLYNEAQSRDFCEVLRYSLAGEIELVISKDRIIATRPEHSFMPEEFLNAISSIVRTGVPMQPQPMPIKTAYRKFNDAYREFIHTAFAHVSAEFQGKDATVSINTENWIPVFFLRTKTGTEVRYHWTINTYESLLRWTASLASNKTPIEDLVQYEALLANALGARRTNSIGEVDDKQEAQHGN